MSDPIGVGLERMQESAVRWGEAAEYLRSAGQRTYDVEIDEYDAGFFGEALNKYRVAPQYFRDRMSEGTTVFGDIARTLKDAHDIYKAQDEAGMHSFQNPK